MSEQTEGQHGGTGNEPVLDEATLMQAAQRLESGLLPDEEVRKGLVSLIGSFLASKSNEKEKPIEQWLQDEFKKYPGAWRDEEELQSAARDVVATVELHAAKKISLEAHRQKGISQDAWLAKEIEVSAGFSGVANVGHYAETIDYALNEANERARQVITTSSGNINGNWNLDGFIAEQNHVDSFNIDAALKGSQYRAVLVQSNGLNSADIQIVDANGVVVKTYQVKYGGDSATTKILLDSGDYGDQQPIVPEGQAKDIPGSAESIEFDGVKSKPLSKEEAKELQRKAQQEAESKFYDWSEANRVQICKQLGKQAIIGAGITAAAHGLRIFGGRAWNAFNGKENNPFEEDLKEFFDSSLRGAAHVGVQVAVSGAVVVAVKNGLLGKALKATPAGRIANIAVVAMENVKILYKLAKGELSKIEAIDAMGRVTVTSVAAIAAAAKGATLGASIGTVFGPVGTVVGGVVGGMIAGAAGQKIADVVYEGGKKILQVGGRILSAATESVGKVGNFVVEGFSKIFKLA